MFDSSVVRHEPATFPLNHVIPGWTEGVQLMKVGDKVRFWIPGNLAYDNPAKPSREGVPHGMLVFDVELLGIE
jgi:peptidylprolyl isomerase